MLLKRLWEFFLDLIEIIVFAVAIFLFIYLLVLQPHKIKGASMEPNFPNGEYLLTDKVSYRFREPERGEIIVFEAPNQRGEEYIKRIVGLPGETISIKDNSIYINTQALNESYVTDKLRTSPSTFLNDNEELQIPTNQYFVLGDNRPFSSDSRAWGFISKEKITGRAWLIYWPPKSAGFIKEALYN